VKQGKPLLGICVGMQMLFEDSDEFGATPGLALIKGKVRRFSSAQVVPQVGWNQVTKKRSHPILSGVPDEEFFYFVHSYYCEAVDKSVVVGETNYGLNYASVIAQDHLCGVQFHPEKSQNAGLRLLKNFAHYVRSNTWE
jgi:glutamine amidotransferase